MNLVLTWYWKEWRAQRGLLAAYLGLVFGCIALGLWLTPRHYWAEDEFGMHAVSWFVLAGVLGVVAFAAPGLVRGEFTTKDDQFCRRLPGALWPAWLGKGLFLLVMTLLLPLLGLGFGELYVSLRGEDWNGFFAWQWNGEVEVVWPWQSHVAAAGLLLLPWVWAIGTWMPGGRMAVGGSLLFVLLVGVGVFAVVRQSPGLEESLDWQPWAWIYAPLGVLVAVLSWSRGRRGGGPARSARVGLVTAAVAMLPGGVALGLAAWDYHHPDPRRFEVLEVHGLSPDRRFVLATGCSHPAHAAVPFRIDLFDGRFEQIGGAATWITPPPQFRQGINTGGVRRIWLAVHGDGGEEFAFDLQTGARSELELDEDLDIVSLAPDWLELARVDARWSSSVRGPDGAEAWFEGEDLVRRDSEGRISRQSWRTAGRGWILPMGHGFLQSRDGEFELFTWTGDPVERRPAGTRFLVRDRQVYEQKRGRPANTWWVSEHGEDARRSQVLEGHDVLGLLDDDRLLCAVPVETDDLDGEWQLCWYRPADDTRGRFGENAVVCGRPRGVIRPLRAVSSVLPRDPAGRIWLRCRTGGRDRIEVFDETVGIVEHGIASLLSDVPYFRLLYFPAADRVRVALGAEIAEIDVVTGRRRRLFPADER